MLNKMLKKLFDAHTIADFKEQKIKMLWAFIVMLMGINGCLFIAMLNINSSLHHQQLYITPAEVTQGGYYQTNVIPNAIVYGFTYEIFVAINTFANNGIKDDQANIIKYKYYLSPDYASYLQGDLKKSTNSGELLDTVQTLSPYGTPSNNDVKQVDDNTWIVDLPLRVTHYKDATVIMDAVYDYQIRVVRTASSITFNPWGLAIDGVVSSTRVKTLT